jgi:hypothetical protein
LPFDTNARMISAAFAGRLVILLRLFGLRGIRAAGRLRHHLGERFGCRRRSAGARGKEARDDKKKGASR